MARCTTGAFFAWEEVMYLDTYWDDWFGSMTGPKKKLSRAMIASEAVGLLNAGPWEKRGLLLASVARDGQEHGRGCTRGKRRLGEVCLVLLSGCSLLLERADAGSWPCGVREMDSVLGWTYRKFDW